MSGVVVSPPFRRRRLGRRLRVLREQARMTLDDAAERLEKTRSSLHRIEQGQTRTDIHLVKSMMDLYDIYDEDLFDLVREAAKSGWWQAYGLKDQGYVDVETEADAVLEFSGLNIPGLLQTEAYTRALLRTGRRRTDAELRTDVAVRIIRQRRLTDETQPLQLTAIVDEAALVREVGGPEVMHAQLLHLAEAASLPGISLQLLPKLVFDRLRSQALPPEDSVALIERLAAESYSRP